MTDDELRQFVLGVCDGRIFTSHQIHETDLMPMVFMPVALGAFLGKSEEEINDIGVLWEWLEHAGPRSINGYPVFFSVRTMDKATWTRAFAAIRAELERRESIPL